MSARDFRVALLEAERRGWSITQRKGGHLRVGCPRCGWAYFAAASPSDWRAVRNLTAALARHEADHMTPIQPKETP